MVLVGLAICQWSSVYQCHISFFFLLLVQNISFLFLSSGPVLEVNRVSSQFIIIMYAFVIHACVSGNIYF